MSTVSPAASQPAASGRGLDASLPALPALPTIAPTLRNTLVASTRVQLAVVLGALLVIWHSLGDHALYPPDEGRYASVSSEMVEHGQWLAPHIRDVLHVTKPPLTYWAQAGAMKLLGSTELAVRLPSALAATAVALALYWMARRTCGPLVATLSIGLYAVMPLPVIIGRLGTTDSMLNAWWWMALVCGYFAVQGGAGVANAHARTRATGQWMWLVGFWLAITLTGLTKGPLIFAPVVLMVAWLVLGRRSKELRALKLWIGMPLALAPLAGVAYLFWSADPANAEAIWKMEFIDRLTGEGVHHDPLLEFIPAFFGGLFPASVALLVPGVHVKAREAWACFRAGDLRALMLIAVVLPFIGFSLLAGKQLTYILPLAAPVALLAALSLRRWLPGCDMDGAGQAGALAELPPPRSLPEFRRIGAIAMCVTAVGVPAAATAAWYFEWIPPVFAVSTLLLWSLAFVPAAMGWVACALLWSRPHMRASALACAFLGMLVMWTCLQEVEDDALDALGARTFAARLAAADRPVLACILRDLTVDYYMGRWTEFTWRFDQVPQWLDKHPDGMVLMTQREFARQSKDLPEVAQTLQQTDQCMLWPMRQVVVLERR